MSVLSRVNQVRKTVQHVGRMREIVAVMTRFGFKTVVSRIGLQGFSGGSSAGPELPDTAASFPVRFRMLCEKLGPTFIKLGQILAGRPDLIPDALVEELKKLQDEVTPVSILDIKPLVEISLDRKLEECFSSFDTEPMATASIAQVHAARTLDGDDVVVKVRKPGVAKQLKQDLEILELIARLLHTYVPEIRSFRPIDIIDEFKRSLLQETDFVREVNNIKRYRENFANSAFIVIPKPYVDLSSADVITMERIRGVKLADEAAVRSLGVDPREIIRKGTEAFFQSVMVDGLFHGDPHGGNLIVLPDGRLGVIDLGSVGILSQKSRKAIVSMFLALLTQDYYWLVVEYVNLSPAEKGSRTSKTVERLEREIYNLFAPYHGLPLRQIPSGKLLMDATGVALRNNVVLPRDLILVFKSIMTLEGMARALDPDFDLVAAGSGFAQTVVKSLYSPEAIAKDALFTAKDYLVLTRNLPRQLGETLRQLESGEFRASLNVENLQDLARAHNTAMSKVGLAILSSAFVIAATMVSASHSLPVWGYVSVWVVAGSLSLLSFFRLLR
jgi:ubiquinone biosynthesis protein